MTQSKSSASSALDADLIRALAQILKETDLSEIEIERKDFRIRVARTLNVAAQVSVGPSSPPMPAALLPPQAELAVPPASTASLHGAVTSPMVGTVYLAPAPDKPPFIAVGAKVTRGQTLLIIEAMKTFNEIPAPRDGTVSAILVEAGRPVEYGEPLLILD